MDQFSELQTITSKDFNQKYSRVGDNNGEIGKGGYGIVYKIQSLQDGKIYAEKRFKRGRNQQEGFRIKRQILHIKKLNHQNLVKYYEAYHITTESGFSFVSLIQQYCESSLTQQFAKIYKLQQPVKLNLLIQISRGLAEMHNNFIIHRDIKPSNILIKHIDQKDIIFKICDFGQSINEEGLKQTIPNQGTLLYQPPQLLNFNPEQSKIIGGRPSDIFAFGLIAYQIIAGHNLYGQKTENINVKKAQIKFYSQFDSYFQNLQCSQNIKLILKHCLVKDPQRRIKTNQLLKQLQTEYSKKSGVDTTSSLEISSLPKRYQVQGQLHIQETSQAITFASMLQIYQNRITKLEQTKAYTTFIQTIFEYNDGMKNISNSLKKLGQNCRVKHSLQILFFIIICYYFKFLTQIERKLKDKNYNGQLVKGVSIIYISEPNRKSIFKLIQNQFYQRQQMFLMLKEECQLYSKVRDKKEYSQNLFSLINGKKFKTIMDESEYSAMTNENDTPLSFLEYFTHEQIEEQQKNYFNSLINNKQFNLVQKQKQVCIEIQKLFLRFRGTFV